MRMRRRVLLLLVVALAGGAFAAQAGAHSAKITEARYCDVPNQQMHEVFFTVTSWEGNGAVGSAKWKASRTNRDIRVFQDSDPPNDFTGSKFTGHFDEANGFFFKGSFTVGQGTVAQLQISTKPRARWGDGNRGKHEEVSGMLQRQACSAPVKRFVVVNGKRLRCTVVGTRRADTLSGTRRRDVICGFRGADRIWAGRGNDVVVGGSGSDTMIGSRGHDLMVGGGGADVMSGNLGRDRLRGGPGNDELVGGGAADRLVGGPGHDEIRGGGGPDVLVGGRGRDKLSGQGGRDLFRARDRSRDRLIGGPRRDRAQVNCGRDFRFSIEVTFSPTCR